MNAQAQAMLEASTYMELTPRDGAVVATCTLCGSERTFRPTACLWDVLDAAAVHQRTVHERPVIDEIVLPHSVQLHTGRIAALRSTGDTSRHQCPADDRNESALKFAMDWADVEGDHHKRWVIDQIVRLLTGDFYPDYVAGWEAEFDGRSWDEGIAP